MAEAHESPKPFQHTYNSVLYDCVFPREVLENIKDFDFDKSDVLVVGYPKTGTTWLQEIVWLIENEADTERAAAMPIMSRCPLMELRIPGKTANLDNLKHKPSPRVMNTHLRHDLLAKGLGRGQPKVIVILRNPKDTLVSYYHFYNTRKGFDKIATFSEFFGMFKRKELVFGDWFEHAEGWYGNMGLDNFCFIRYEDMKADHAGSVKRLAEFLGRDLEEAQVARIVEHTSLSSMKGRRSAKMGEEDAKAVVDESKSAFVRKGIVGDWINHFSPEDSSYVDDLLRDTSLPYQEL